MRMDGFRSTNFGVTKLAVTVHAFVFQPTPSRVAVCMHEFVSSLAGCGAGLRSDRTSSHGKILPLTELRAVGGRDDEDDDNSDGSPTGTGATASTTLRKGRDWDSSLMGLMTYVRARSCRAGPFCYRLSVLFKTSLHGAVGN